MSQIDNKTVTQTVTLGTTSGYPTYASPLTITATGEITTAGTAFAIFGSLGTPGTIVNLGTVANVVGNNYIGDAIMLAGGGYIDNSNMITGSAVGIVIDGAAGTVLNSGTIGGGARESIEMHQGGTLTNTQSAVLQGSVYLEGSAGTVIDAGYIVGVNGIYMPAGGGVSVAASGFVKGSFDAIQIGGPRATGPGGSVDNDGFILGGNTSGRYSYAAIQMSTGSVNNHGTISAPRVGGIYLHSGGTVSNSGVIEAYPARYGVRLGGTTGVVVNSGSISGGSFGVVFPQGGAVSNAQTGYILSGGAGIAAFGSAATIVDAGRVVGLGRQGGIYLAEGGYASIAAGGSVGGRNNAGILVYGAAGTILDGGTITGGQGTAIRFGGAGVNLVALEPGYSITGSITGSGTAGAANTLQLAGSAGAPLTVDYNGLSLGNFQDVSFGAGAYDTLRIGNTSGTVPVTISGLVATHETIDLTGIGGNGSIAGQSATQLTIAGSGGTVTLQLDASDATQFNVAPDGATGTDVVVCYAAGTMILTETGEVAVEELRIGDRVVTLCGAAKPIKWIGRRAYGGPFLNGNRALLPIRIKAGALAAGIPRRDLLVSPKHALFLQGMLLPAEALANGVSIVQDETVEAIAYWHIEFDRHDVILAEGAAAESYVDCDNRGQFHNAVEFARLYPGADPERWRFCAPRVEEGPDLIRVRRWLARRAGLPTDAAGEARDQDAAA